jgi:hypothetical protein
LRALIEEQRASLHEDAAPSYAPSAPVVPLSPPEDLP